MKYLSIIALGLIIIGCARASEKNETIQTQAQASYLETDRVMPFKVPTEFLPGVLVYHIDPNKDTVLSVGDRDTKLHIQANTFVDINGLAISESVEISFREYTNAAEIAFSKIPMTLNLDDEEFCFNSSGMFEISGQSEGVDVEIAPGKALEIDYALAKQNPDIDFYKLKADSSNWELIEEIEEIQDDEPFEMDLVVNGQSVNDTIAVINESEDFPVLFVENVDPLLGNNNQFDANEQNELFANEINIPDNGNRTIGTLLAPGAGAGHTYPSIIAGLQLPSFGVYNCDQIYRLKDRLSIQANYIDEDKNPINDFSVLSLIDLNYNGAFSFDPRSFICSASGKNVLLLFTRSGKLYMLNNEAYAAMDIEKNGSYTFQMEDVSGKIRNSNDLSMELGL